MPDLHSLGQARHWIPELLFVDCRGGISGFCELVLALT
ncbi:hypothetical protein K377_07800 [Streptomyces sp. PsTaAH-137]|nr:hypothetical protein K377_07800 [Streptomyces sp. PsTaAH-137]